jgi:hypothetical protein
MTQERIYGSQVKSLIRKVETSNEKYKSQDSRYEDSSRQVTVTLIGGDTNHPSVENQIDNMKVYKIEAVYNNNGTITEIKIYT